MVATYLQSQGISQTVIDAFKQNSVTGEIIIDGISKEDLIEIGITGSLLQRSVLATLNKLKQ
jgi:hypothetical protein